MSARIKDIPLVDQVAETLGQASYTLLCENMGGTRLPIPARIPPNHHLAVVLGKEQAALLAREFSGLVLEIPMTLKKKAAILNDIRGGEPSLVIARRYWCSKRYVQRLRAEMLDGGESKQGELF
jgi:hypothetical protein